MPKGELCVPVDLDCVVNASRSCDSDCATQVAYFHELCVLRYRVRQNATFEYNISSCQHPDGWRVGTEKWRYYYAKNASDPLAERRAHRGDHLWEYDDVADQTILNCTSGLTLRAWIKAELMPRITSGIGKEAMYPMVFDLVMLPAIMPCTARPS